MAPTVPSIQDLSDSINAISEQLAELMRRNGGRQPPANAEGEFDLIESENNGQHIADHSVYIVMSAVLERLRRLEESVNTVGANTQQLTARLDQSISLLESNGSTHEGSGESGSSHGGSAENSQQ